MKKRVYGHVYVVVYKDIEIEDVELDGLEEDEIDELFIEKAYEEFSGISNFVGNGGNDKLLGVYGYDEGLYDGGEVEFTDVEEME